MKDHRLLLQNGKHLFASRAFKMLLNNAPFIAGSLVPLQEETFPAIFTCSLKVRIFLRSPEGDVWEVSIRTDSY